MNEIAHTYEFEQTMTYLSDPPPASATPEDMQRYALVMGLLIHDIHATLELEVDENNDLVVPDYFPPFFATSRASFHHLSQLYVYCYAAFKPKPRPVKRKHQNDVQDANDVEAPITEDHASAEAVPSSPKRRRGKKNKLRSPSPANEDDANADNPGSASQARPPKQPRKEVPVGFPVGPPRKGAKKAKQTEVEIETGIARHTRGQERERDAEGKRQTRRRAPADSGDTKQVEGSKGNKRGGRRGRQG